MEKLNEIYRMLQTAVPIYSQHEKHPDEVVLSLEQHEKIINILKEVIHELDSESH